MNLEGGRVVTRSPLPAHVVVAEIGTLLDLVVLQRDQEAKVRPGRATALYWHVGRKALVWWMGDRPKLSRGAAESPAERVAERAFETWGVWTADRIGRARRRGPTEWRSFPALRVGYRSDKFGDLESYEHDFGPQVRAYQPTGASGPWVVCGGALRLTGRGLMG